MNNLLELVMIVKNSGNSIINTLNSIKPFIDSYTILDTGSTDGTQKLILDTMKGVKGNLYEESFIDFATSRNRALELAGKKCKYTIMLDDTYQLNGGKLLRKILEKNLSNSYKAFHIMIRDENNYEYYSLRILKTSSNLQYTYRIHEVVLCDPKYVYTLPNNIYIYDIVNMYMKNRSLIRHKKDLIMLKEDYEKNPNDKRIIFYLARTCMSLNKYEDAIKYFTKRISLTSHVHWSGDEEIYWSMYHKAILLSFLENDWDTDIKPIFSELIKYFPNRAEPLYQYAYYYYRKNDYNNAFIYINKAMTLPIPKCYLGVEKRIYEIEIKYLFCEIAIQLQKFNIVEKVLKMIKTTDMRFYNMIYSISNIPKIGGIRFEKKSIVFHTGDVVNKWNPNNMIEKKCSGSEVMAYNLAKEFVKLGYRVFIFGNVDEGVFEGVEFYHSDLYFEFINKYHINYLIISRFVDNLSYLETIDNVYLWLHDITAQDIKTQGIIQIHKTKFKNVICLSDWHFQKIIKTYNIPNNFIYKSRNAIYTERFNNTTIEKIPYRFIYISSYDRGLDYLLQMIPKIKERYSQTTLYIFSNISENQKQYINNIQNNKDYIFVQPRVSQEQISIELLKSDIFLYPTDFEETYCISALEAQMAGCLCATTTEGALSEIVGNRGITISGDISLEETQNQLLKKLYYVLDTPQIKNNYIIKAKEWAKLQDYKNLASTWINDIL